ncbi:MAG: DUF2267 domain-containing protein [Gammaproteobacteria bacterium]
MSMTGIKVFDNTLHKTDLWLNDVMKTMSWHDRHKAYIALRAVLHTIRDRMTPDEAIHLGAELPMLIRGFYYEGWHLADKPLKYRHKDEFLAHIKEQLRGVDYGDLEKVAGAVFAVLSKYVGGGEIRQVREQLPGEIQALWR